MASKASGGEDKEAMKRAMLERLKERKAASSSASNLLDDEDDDATRRVQSMKAGGSSASLLNQRGGARASLNPTSVGRGTSMTPEEREAMVAKLKSQKRATVGTTGAAALSRSKSAGVAAAGAESDKHAQLKKRLESFNKLKTEKEETDSAPVEEEERAKKPAPAAVLKKAQTEKSIPTTRRSPGDALLDKDSSDEETAPPVKKAAEFSVGDKLEALYLDDGLWYNAKIEQANDDGTFTVIFTDYGNQQVCQPSELRRKKDEKAQRLEKIKNRQQSAKEEVVKSGAGEEEQQQQQRWRGASEIGVVPAELASKTSSSKRDREKAHRGTFSQLGNDSVAGGGLFAEDASVVTDARRKAKENAKDAEPEEEEEEEVVEEKQEEEEEEPGSPSFLAKLFGSGKKEKQPTPPPPEKTTPPATKEKGFFARFLGSSSEDEKEVKKPVTPPSKKKGGFFEDLFAKKDGESEEDDPDDDDEDVAKFFGKK